MTGQLKYIDLFSGCGGLSTGLYLAGWKGLFAVERSASAFMTLKANLIDNRSHFEWPSWMELTNWDINKLISQHSENLEELQGAVDLIAGGPPCQGFSTAGRRVKTDKRNKLIHSYLKFVQLVLPKAILFENVQGFTMKFKAETEEGVAYSKVVIHELRRLGYEDARGELIDMSEYGVPQKRKRFIVIATRMGTADAVFECLKQCRSAFLSDRGVPRKNGVKSAISDLQQCHGSEPCPDSARFKSGVTSRPRTGLQKHLRDDHARHVPDSHRFVNHTPDVQAVFRRLLEGAPRNRTIVGAEREQFGLRKRSVTVLSGDAPALTVTTIPDDFVHYSEPRVMTVRECARLQTFPDWFEFKGPYTTGGQLRLTQIPRYSQVGNAVPPLFSEMAGVALKKVLSNA